MKALTLAAMLTLPDSVPAAGVHEQENLCNFQIASRYQSSGKCRFNDIVIGVAIEDGILKVECGSAIVLCQPRATEPPQGSSPRED